MKTRIFLMMLLAIASVGAKADEVRCILPCINVTDIVVIIDAIMGEADPQQTKHRTASQQTPKATTTGVYNTAGQRINKMQRGVNIADGKKVLF